MAPSRGASSLAGAHPEALRALLATATLVTPNLPEASRLLGVQVDDASAPSAAQELVALGADAVLVKGGHGSGVECVDWLALRGGRGADLVRIARQRRPRLEVHGTGCTLAALITGRLAARSSRRAVRPDEIVEAVRWSRAKIDRALAAPLVVGGGQRVLRLGRASSPA
jgi:hydroxymethylpyrimidine/phosphomethylpyrimidine kinase